MGLALCWFIVIVAEVESYWTECLALPSKLEDWDAYTGMKGSIQAYHDIFPLFHSLASRVRHLPLYSEVSRGVIKHLPVIVCL